jgi:hypothetical protein
MPVPQLSDGTPITYDWFNAVSKSISDIEAKLKADETFVLFGESSADSANVQVVTASQAINVKGAAAQKSLYEFTVNFPKKFIDNKVVVVAMVTTTPDANKKIKPAGVAVGNITSTSFKAVIQLFEDEAKLGTIKLELRYIAIGKREQVF